LAAAAVLLLTSAAAFIWDLANVYKLIDILTI
jgi:hypothetical protein